MDFELSDDQRLLQDSVTPPAGRPLQLSPSARAIWSSRRAGAAELWAQFAELGLLGLPFAEEYGGFGGGPQ